MQCFLNLTANISCYPKTHDEWQNTRCIIANSIYEENINLWQKLFWSYRLENEFPSVIHERITYLCSDWNVHLCSVRIAVFSVSVLHDERIVVVAEQRPDASEEDSFQWMSRVLQVCLGFRVLFYIIPILHCFDNLTVLLTFNKMRIFCLTIRPSTASIR